MIRVAQFSVLAAAIGAGTLSVPVAGFQLSLFRALILLLAILAITESLYRGRTSVRRERTLEYPQWFMVVWLLFSIISVLWVKDFPDWVQGTFFITIATSTIVLYFIAFKDPKTIRTAFAMMAFMTVVHNIIGWYESLTGNLLFLASSASAGIYADRGYAASTFGNTNDFATYLTVGLGSLFITAISSKSKIVQAGVAVAMASTVGLVINSDSRANILALLIGIGAYIVISFLQRRKPVIAALIVGCLACLYLLSGRLGTSKLPGDESRLSFNFEGGRNSETVRINLIKNALGFVVDTYGFGTGAGNAEYWMANYAKYPTWGILNVHNWWVEIAATYGILIFLGYLVFYYWILSSLLRSAVSNQPRVVAMSSKVIASTLFAFAFGAISSSSNISSEWLWAFFGLVAVYVSSVARTTPESEPAAAPNRKEASR